MKKTTFVLLTSVIIIILASLMCMSCTKEEPTFTSSIETLQGKYTLTSATINGDTRDYTGELSVTNTNWYMIIHSGSAYMSNYGKISVSNDTIYFTKYTYVKQTDANSVQVITTPSQFSDIITIYYFKK